MKAKQTRSAKQRIKSRDEACETGSEAIRERQTPRTITEQSAKRLLKQLASTDGLKRRAPVSYTANCPPSLTDAVLQCFRLRRICLRHRRDILQICFEKKRIPGQRSVKNHPAITFRWLAWRFALRGYRDFSDCMGRFGDRSKLAPTLLLHCSL
jgi:hypothetical protein